MPRAVLKNGSIVPIDPLPKEWVEGTELEVDQAKPDQSAQSLEEWYRELEQMCSENTAADIDQLEAALQNADDRAKQAVHQAEAITSISRPISSSVL